jgi:hypothetical protein
MNKEDIERAYQSIQKIRRFDTAIADAADMRKGEATAFGQWFGDIRPNTLPQWQTYLDAVIEDLKRQREELVASLVADSVQAVKRDLLAELRAVGVL